MTQRHLETSSTARAGPRDDLTARPPDDRSRALKGGVVAGLVGGVAVAAYLALQALLQGGPLAAVFKGAALPFFSPERVGSAAWDPAPLALGLLSHFGVSIVWGVLFGLLFYGLSRAGTLVAGLFWGLVVWIGMFYVVLPLVGGYGVTQATPVWSAALMHLVFGLFTALGFLPFQRKVPRRAQPLSRGRTPLELDRRQTPVTP